MKRSQRRKINYEHEKGGEKGRYGKARGRG
jgi:hypothetical protein